MIPVAGQIQAQHNWTMVGTQFAGQQEIAAFPRVYRPGGSWRILLLLISFLLGGFAAAGLWYFGTGHEVGTLASKLFLCGICLIFVLLSGYLIAWMFLARLTLWPDRIENRDLMRGRTLYRRDILGRRIVEQHNAPSMLVLFPRGSSAKKMKISNIFRVDALFMEWIGSLPDLDAEDQLAARQDIMSNQELGITPVDRLAAFDRGKRLSRLLSGATFALGAWAWLYPVPYRLVVSLLVLLPCVGLVIVSRSSGLFRIDERRNDPHPSVAVAVMLPGFVLMLRVISDMNLLEWTGPLYISAALAALLTVAAVMADRSLQSRRGLVILLFILSLSYGFGAGMEGNALLDHSKRSVYATKITEKEISSGRYRSYDLYLARWGPKQDNDKVSVPRSFYDSVGIGDTVCVSLRQGAFHVQWYIVGPCTPARLREAGK
jgi:hypothetical protein